MKRVLAPSVLALVALLGVTATAGDVKSGLQVGEAATYFPVTDITGPAKGKTLCYR